MIVSCAIDNLIHPKCWITFSDFIRDFNHDGKNTLFTSNSLHTHTKH